MLTNAFVPCTEKYVKAKVSLMSCSPKLDLLAVTCSSGELILYRLVTGAEDKLPVWTLPVPQSGIEIHTICWRPDGKVIAVSYSSASDGVQFVYMEKAEILWRLSSTDRSLVEPVTLLKWIPLKTDNFTPKNSDETDSLDSEVYLPKVMTLETGSKEFSGKYMDNFGDNDSNILLMCEEMGCVTVMVNGIFPIQKICCDPDFFVPKCHMNIIDIQLSSNLDFLCVVAEKNEEDMKKCFTQIYDIKVLSESMPLYITIAQKALKISSLKSHLGAIFDSMDETCDTVMHEVENQFTNFLVKKNPTGDIGEDFMQLLIWGKPSESLKNILTHHLTKKQIKKLGQLVESSYASIQQLLIVQFQMALDTLYYHFTEIRGIVLDPKNKLSFLANDVEEIITTTGSLMLKTTEFLQVISTSLKNYKAFFRWLYVSMLKMQEEPVDKMVSMSENEIAFIADFIYEHFSVRTKQGVKREKQFILEKVYQYLKDEELSLPVKNNTNEWVSFVSASGLLNHSKLMLQNNAEMSLRQLYNLLANRLQSLICKPKWQLNEMCSLTHYVQLFESSENFPTKCRLWLRPHDAPVNESAQEKTKDNKISEIVCILTTDSKFPSNEVTYFCMEVSNLERDGGFQMKGIKMRFQHFDEINESITEEASVCENYLRVVDFDSYNDNTVTVLLCDKVVAGKKSEYWLSQVSLGSATRQMEEVLQFSETTQSSNKFFFTFPKEKLPSIDVGHSCTDVRILRSDIHALSVVSSAERKAACVLSTDKQMMFPFLLDSAEEEEGDDGVDVTDMGDE